MDWEAFEVAFEARYGFLPKLEGVLLMIGVDALGAWPEGPEKETKRDLIGLGLGRLLVWSGYAVETGRDAAGWPQFELVKRLPYQDSEAETAFLRKMAAVFFAEIWRNLEHARTRDP